MPSVVMTNISISDNSYTNLTEANAVTFRLKLVRSGSENIAPHTPPPICRAIYAAFTMASTFIFVMSLRTISNGIIHYSPHFFFTIISVLIVNRESDDWQQVVSHAKIDYYRGYSEISSRDLQVILEKSLISSSVYFVIIVYRQSIVGLFSDAIIAWRQDYYATQNFSFFQCQELNRTVDIGDGSWEYTVAQSLPLTKITADSIIFDTRYYL